MLSKNLIKFVHSLELKKNRKREGLFVAEGPKVVNELIKRFRIHTVITTNPNIVNNESFANSPNISQMNYVETDEEGLKRVSFLQHPQQILAIFHINEQTEEQIEFPTENITLALDGVQDPGNLGTIIRIADWFNIDNIVCSLDTADVYNPKVVQATMGSLARVNVHYTELDKYLASINKDTPIYGTLLDGKDIYSTPLTHNGIIIMGNEGNGISDDIRKHITHRLLIPNFRQGDGAESLNVAIATALTCAEFRRR